ncbi:MAG TPA: allantoicase [Gemmatimonadaceae bacterium]|nr:allantoicase [Gemmatimonadaceae bacterium]
MTEFTDLVDLASERLGAAVILANDEFFAPKENLLRAAPAEWREGVYTERGKWMDGWETRRRRSPGHDWCIVRLGAPGIVRGVVVDTSFFRGNYPEHCSLEGCNVEGMPSAESLAREARWREILPSTPLQGDTRNTIEVDDDSPVTHLRFNIFPDGGVARLRVHGEVTPDWTSLVRGGDVDLAAMEHGGWVVVCSDMFFGHRQHLILPGRSTHMGDGWETRRRRGPGNDWTIVRLGRPGSIRRVELDTDHFKGNAPGACSMAWCYAPDASPEALAASAVVEWRELLARTDLQPHARHHFDRDLKQVERATHVRLDIYPDGGVARLRVFGRPETGP